MASPCSTTRTTDEPSGVCFEEDVLDGVTGPPAEVGVSALAATTFETQYVLVKEERLDLAPSATFGRGHAVRK